jgi:hypothetical protein
MGERWPTPTYRLESVARGVDEEEAAVDPRVGDETVAHGCELLAEVGGMLVLDLVRRVSDSESDWIDRVRSRCATWRTEAEEKGLLAGCCLFDSLHSRISRSGPSNRRC